MPHYRDYAGPNFPSLGGLARYRIRVQARLLDNTVCPAAEYPFMVSNDGGKSWHPPPDDAKAELERIVREQEGCCRNLGDECPLNR